MALLAAAVVASPAEVADVSLVVGTSGVSVVGTEDFSGSPFASAVAAAAVAAATGGVDLLN